MHRKQLIILELFLFAGLFSCKVYKPVVSTSSMDKSAENYINEYKDLAVSEMKRTGIPASITLAQGMIESDYGHSTLAREANNHFGIKCHNDWKGPTIRHHDDKRNECFRKYSKAEESFYDHSDFLKSGSRYSFLFNIKPTDYKRWAHGLKKAGYATNPDYAAILISTIEDNNLWYFDRGSSSVNLPPQTTLPSEESAEVPDKGLSEKPELRSNVNEAVASHVLRLKENNRIQFVTVRDGDTREKIEKEFQLLNWELAKYNELDNDFEPVTGQILYLQPKRDKAEPGKEYCTTKAGDTMYLISQRYGIKLKKLYEMNRMEEGTEPEAGNKLWLRSMKPVN